MMGPSFRIKSAKYTDLLEKVLSGEARREAALIASNGKECNTNRN